MYVAHYVPQFAHTADCAKSAGLVNGVWVCTHLLGGKPKQVHA
jgi:hypothetical protein